MWMGCRCGVAGVVTVVQNVFQRPGVVGFFVTADFSYFS